MKILVNIEKVMILLLLTLATTACGGGGSPSTPDSVSGSETNPIYIGSYSGDFVGADSGTWQFTVNADTSVSGTLTTTTLPITSYVLSGSIDAQGNVVLLSGSTADAIRCDIFINNGIATGTWTDGTGVGSLSGIITSSDAVTGSLAVSAEFGDKVFTPLNVNQLNLAPLQIVSFNDQLGNVIPIEVGIDNHILALYIDQSSNVLVAVAYSFFNTVAISETPTSYDYQINCVDNACAAINLDLAQSKVSFTNVSLPVLVFEPGSINTNIAINPATVNGTFTWK
ncbi:hypothetical protein MNBD_GAMMA22-2399 [hydrothermal vent metagenome]|uniref:Uncharacterized protein n=1 Tax=hydrothermal vent metagenome TaxID=652676 RepID=A0A3B0ZXT5_9ZZZZ